MTFEGRRNRKHVARKQREDRLRRYLIIGLAVLATLVIGVLAYGYYDVNIRQPNTPVITVEGEQISRDSFRARIQLLQTQLLTQLQSSQQLLSFFGSNPEIQQQLQQDMQRIQSQLENPVILGQQTVEQMIRDELVKQEAERRGITVTEAEVDQAIQESFGYYAQGTPTPGPTNTPRPTMTPDPTQLAQVTPTQTATQGPTPTITLTPTPFPTSTPYTEELFNADYQAYIDQLEADGIAEEDFRSLVRAELYRQKLIEAFEEEVPRTQEQVRARHILVEEEETAQDVLEELDEGAEWDELAAEYSIDESNKDQGGELGWFGRGRMVEPFEQAAFAAEVGEIVGPVETSFGYHLIEVMEREERELSDQAYQQAVQVALNDWLTEARQEAEVDVDDSWPQMVPPPPGFGLPSQSGQAPLQPAQP